MQVDIFEKYALDYDRWFDEHAREYDAELSRIRRLMPAPDSRSIEVGIGSGRFAAPLGITLGIEPSQSLGRMARERGIEVVRGRVEALPIRNASCSSVLLVTVICFLDDPAEAFAELHRILVPGGFLVLACIERGGAIHRKYIMDGGKGRFLSRARFYSREEIGEALGKAGFACRETDCRLGFCIIVAQAYSVNST